MHGRINVTFLFFGSSLQQQPNLIPLHGVVYRAQLWPRVFHKEIEQRFSSQMTAWRKISPILGRSKPHHDRPLLRLAYGINYELQPNQWLERFRCDSVTYKCQASNYNMPPGEKYQRSQCWIIMTVFVLTWILSTKPIVWCITHTRTAEPLQNKERPLPEIQK